MFRASQSKDLFQMSWLLDFLYFLHRIKSLILQWGGGGLGEGRLVMTNFQLFVPESKFAKIPKSHYGLWGGGVLVMTHFQPLLLIPNLQNSQSSIAVGRGRG